MKTKDINGMDGYRIAGKYYGDTNNCAVVAVAVACRVAYGKAHHALRRAGREVGQGTHIWQTIAAIKELRPAATIETMSPTAYEFVGRTIGAFEREGPRTGTYLVTMKCTARMSHIACMRDGVLQDWTAKERTGKARRYTITAVREVQLNG